MEINKKSKITSFLFADNAGERLIIELEKAIKTIEFDQIESLIKKENIKNISLIFPFVIRTVVFPCKEIAATNLFTKKEYFAFKGKAISGFIKFCDIIGYKFYSQ